MHLFQVVLDKVYKCTKCTKFKCQLFHSIFSSRGPWRQIGNCIQPVPHNIDLLAAVTVDTPFTLAETETTVRHSGGYPWDRSLLADAQESDSPPSP